jgi:hypothetical protein
MRQPQTWCALAASLGLVWGLAQAQDPPPLVPVPIISAGTAPAELPPMPVPIAGPIPEAIPLPDAEQPPPAEGEKPRRRVRRKREKTASPSTPDGQSSPPPPPAESCPADEKQGSGDACPLRPPELLGDQAPVNSLLLLPRGPIGGNGAIQVPSARYFKISDNESPRPQDRTYFSFNYFYNLDGAVNERAGGGIQHTRIHREIWGIEWADKEGTSSLGLRLPLNTYNAANTVPGLDGTSTDIGDLSIIFKYVAWKDDDTGRLVSAGLAVTPPTGPGSFAGAGYTKVFHTTGLQPFCGWIWTAGKFYVQGFTAVDAPTDLNDVVLLSNDLAIGYYVYQKPGEQISAVVPTFEVHVTTPLNHRGVLGLNDPAGTPDLIDLTGGIHFEYSDRSSMGVAFAMPVTGPRPFEFEILAQFRWRY